MSHSSKFNSKINKLQKRSLKIVYNSYITLFEDLPKKDNSFKNPLKKIQSLARGLFKVETGIANSILYDIFPLRSIDYYLRSQIYFSESSANTNIFGLNSVQYFALRNNGIQSRLNLKA